MKLLKCPFCNKNDEDNKYFTSISQKDDCWSLTHFCRELKDELYCCITVYGKSEEEVIELWNKRASQ